MDIVELIRLGCHRFDWGKRDKSDILGNCVIACTLYGEKYYRYGKLFYTKSELEIIKNRDEILNEIE